MDTTNPHNAHARAYSAELDIRITDSSLRDGSHHKRHQFSVEDVRNVVAALDGAGVPVIEVAHGPAAALEERGGGVGALLRYRIDCPPSAG